MAKTMAKPDIIAYDKATAFERGDGVVTRSFVGHDRGLGAHVCTGTTTFPKGTKIPFHSHNCDEQVLILDGEAQVDIEGEAPHFVKTHDMSFIPEGRVHRFINTGDGPLTILWIYDTEKVTRTFAELGKTVPHLSAYDKV